MIAVAIIGLVAAFAGPAMQDMISNNKVVSKANDIATALSFARTEAIRRGERVSMAPIDGENWARGIHLGMSNDFESNKLKGGAEPLRTITSSNHRYQMTVAASHVEFNGRGFIESTFTIELCDNTSSKLEEGRIITVEGTGKVSVEELSCKEDS